MDRHRESFLELINNYVDVVFCNESELLSLFQKDKYSNCEEHISHLCDIFVVTLGGKGSLIINKDQNLELIQTLQEL